MSTEALDRHKVFQERIDRAKEMVRRAEAACQALVFGDQTLGELDAENTVQRSVRALLPVAAKTPGYDIVLTLCPAQAWGVRVHNVDNTVLVTAVQWGDGPPEEIADPAPAAPDGSTPEQSSPAEEVSPEGETGAGGPDLEPVGEPEDDVVSALADLLRN